MFIKNFAKYFDKGSVCVVGMKGSGKDMLFANVAATRKKAYISNTNYHIKGVSFLPLRFDLLDVGKNSYRNFVEGNLNKYVYPYGDEMDIYIADCGVYFPAQYCNDLNKLYPYIPTYMALSRQLGESRVHINCQNLNRIWDKLREHSDFYVYCNKCIYIKGFVIQSVTIYDKYESCVNRVKPFKMRLPIGVKKEMKNLALIEKEKFRISNGLVENKILIYRNKSKYNTRIFKEMLENGKEIQH